MSKHTASFVFVHGAWHGAATWRKVTPLLEAAGFSCHALDLPGAGSKARFPKSFSARPLDAAAFATEISPNAGVTQEERTAAVVDAVENAASSGHGKVILVGHSLGGITLSPVAEAIPDKLAAVVYLTAFMLPPGMPAIAMIQHETMASALVPGLFAADPQVVGALRIDTQSDDADDRARLKAAFYGDVDEDDFDAMRMSMHCDEPASVALVPSPVSESRFAQVPRHYIRCLQDRAITPAGQEYMIAAMDSAMGNKTHVHTLDTSHSPFLSRPDELAGLLATMAG